MIASIKAVENKAKLDLENKEKEIYLITQELTKIDKNYQKLEQIHTAKY